MGGMNGLCRGLQASTAVLTVLVASACGAAAPSPTISAAPSSAAASAPAQLTPVTMQISALGLAFFPALLARDLGIFAKHGIEANIVNMPPPAAIAGMQKGEVQFITAIGSAGRGIERGLPMRIVEIALDRPPLELVGGPGITEIDQLKGKVLTAGAPDESLTQIMVTILDKHGLPPGSYQIVPTGPNQTTRLGLLANKQAAGTPVDTVYAIANADELKAAGDTMLARMSQEYELPFSGLTTSLDLIQNKPDVVRRTVAAMVEANQVASSDKERTSATLAKELSVSPEGAAKVFDRAKELKMYSSDGRATASGLSLLFKLDQAALNLPATPTEAQLFDWSFLPAASPRAS